MSYTDLLTDTAEVLEAPVVTNDFGQEVRDWDAAVVVATISPATGGGCSVQPASSDEDTMDRQTTRTEWWFYSQHPAAYAIEATQRLRWAGVDFDINVDSAAMRWRAGFSVPAVEHHVALKLQLIEG